MGQNYAIAQRQDGKLIVWGAISNPASTIPDAVLAKNIVDFDASASFASAIDDTGYVYVWGSMNYGIEEIPSYAHDAVAISTGTNHVLALQRDGTVIAWGRNDWGQTNVPLWLNDVTAIAAGSSYSLALRANGTVVSWGGHYLYNMTPPATLQRVIAISAGEGHALALLDDATIVGWGDDRFRQATAPIGTFRKAVAVSAGLHYSLALLNNGRVIGWGLNTHKNISIPTTLQDVVSIEASYSNSVFATRNGGMVIIGSNATGLNSTRTNTPGIFINGRTHTPTRTPTVRRP